MSYRTFILLIIIGSIISFQGVTAVVPDTIVMTGSPVWVVAGNSNTASITVRALNNSAGVGNASVILTCLNSSLGTITPATPLYADSNGYAQFKFTPKTVSGIATLRAWATMNESANDTYDQKIDHNTPKYYDQVIYNSSQTVATDTTITIRLKDVYGNPIDSKREDDEGRTAENVIFADSPDSNGGFWFGSFVPVHRFIKQVNASGNATVMYRLPTRAGDNVLQITAPSGVISNTTNTNYMWITIKGLPSEPRSIVSLVKTPPYDVDPAPPNLAVANGEDIFQIYYTLYDFYGNPVPGKVVHWTATSDTGKVETKDFLTNYQGIVYLEYGPSTELQKIYLSASLSPEFPTIEAAKDELRFVTGGPAIFDMYTNPILLASRDANNESFAYVRAHLMDNMGRGIEGEVVSFDIVWENGTPISPLNFSSFSNSELLRTTNAITDIDGYATVQFYPGTFPDEFNDSFVSNATGVANIRGYWRNEILNLEDEDTVSITYKNYPYLRAETFVSPTTVDVNKTVNITIMLTGDGYAPHLPIDLMLCDSRAEPMLKDMQYLGDKGAVQDKMVYVHQVTSDFTFKFRSNRDRIGIVTFGNNAPTYLNQSSGFRAPGDDNNDNDAWYVEERYMAHVKAYDDYATVDVGLGNPKASNMTLMRDEVKNMTPSKDPSWLPNGRYLSPIRYGLYKAIRELNISSSTGDRVKAVIVLTDRAWSQAGDPIARNPDKGMTLIEMPLNDTTWPNGGKSYFTIFEDLGTMYSPLQNMSNYAIASGVRIYVVAYPEKGNSINSDDTATFTILSTSTGGRYFTANNVNELSNIYGIIAEELKRYAGANTIMGLDFSNISVMYNNVTQDYPGSEVFTYEFEQGVSTAITSWNKTANPIPDALKVPPYPAMAIPAPANGSIFYPYSLDQRGEWATNGLSFYVGNISIKQTWQAKFRLKALKPGLINLFGNSSAICFVSLDGSSCIEIPGTFITAIQNLTAETIEQPVLDIIDGSLIATPIGTEEILNVTWVLNYTSNNTVEQRASYQFSSDGSTWSGNWVEFGKNITGGDGVLYPANYSLLLDVREKVGYVKIKVFSYEIPLGGASDVEEIRDAVQVGRHRAANIKIS